MYEQKFRNCDIGMEKLSLGGEGSRAGTKGRALTVH